MKSFIAVAISLLFISCSEDVNLSPSKTAEIVVESFYHRDNNTLKKHTTAEGFTNLMSIQNLFLKDKNSATAFKLINETVDGEIAWVQYSVAYDPKPSVFKLVKENGSWKVTHKGPRDNGPF
ncbi:hypothetical protein DCS32_15345 [Dokdonia sp. Dokd-P16]|uniref:hypothetical protein n=1 Tax=Dokdonia sp. Dokd-P16 TaxID=2173169 RepID=UPI000D544AAB|nr:hypothetical protein [Dokdonia sp. Dokd-P16]AWH75486.1 hypothetical protein DCS32_15345 [Dokdonia sp. Dokd-P16]